MAYTGYKQATVAYKVRTADGAALDINGDPIEQSGRKQAIALLSGTANPNAALYEVAYVFTAEETLEGQPTVEISDDCPAGYLFIYPAPTGDIALTLAAPTLTLLIESSGPWTSTGPAAITVTPGTGPRGETSITLSRNGNGQGLITFTNTVTGQTATLYALSVDVATWILQTGLWNNSGVWAGEGIWNY